MSEMWEFLPSSSCGCGRPKASWDGCFPVPRERIGDSRGGAWWGGYWNGALLLGWDWGCRVELTMPELAVLSLGVAVRVTCPDPRVSPWSQEATGGVTF